jgi:hypothetical protein
MIEQARSVQRIRVRLGFVAAFASKLRR